MTIDTIKIKGMVYRANVALAVRSTMAEDEGPEAVNEMLAVHLSQMISAVSRLTFELEKERSGLKI